MIITFVLPICFIFGRNFGDSVDSVNKAVVVPKNTFNVLCNDIESHIWSTMVGCLYEPPPSDKAVCVNTTAC